MKSFFSLGLLAFILGANVAGATGLSPMNPGDLRLVSASDFKSAGVLVQQAGEAAISSLRQKVLQLTQSFQMRGKQNQIFFTTIEGSGCSNILTGNEEVVAGIKYVLAPKSKTSEFQSEKISYYGCGGELLFSEVIQSKALTGASPTLSAKDILDVIRKFHVEPNEERRIYRVLGSDDQTILVTIDSFRSKQGWTKTKFSVADNLLVELLSWTDAQNQIDRTEMHKPPYKYSLQINNSSAEVESTSDLTYKILLTKTGVRYMANGELITLSAFDTAIREILLRIGNTRLAFVYNASMSGFPQSQSAPKLNRLIEQLTEAKILLESNLNKDRVLEIINDLLAGANNGKISDGR